MARFFDYPQKHILIMETTFTKEGRIFNNRFLDMLTRTSPTLTLLSYGSIVMLFLYLNFELTSLTITNCIVLFASGLFFWTFFEYLMHRFVFHFMSEKPLAKKIHYALHGVHHENPRDEDRIFMPPVPGIIIISIVFVIFYSILDQYTFGFLAGWLSGYLAYSFIHYHVHVSKPHRYFRILWTHHALHHYKYDDKAFGVSTPLWDIVFGTMPPKNKLHRIK